ncbi:MAG TPA: aspartate dehydrogenase [Euryarchaeota archaeon]|nr:aspartate dehydrogenase [Euryarchaeota archaeon]
MKILILGCGSIGTVIARAADEMEDIEEILLHDIDRSKIDTLMSKISRGKSLEEGDIASSGADILIEAASQGAAKENIPVALESGMDAMILSVGAFVDLSFQNRCYSALKDRDINLLIPSGSIAGIDALKAAGCASIDVVRLTTTKPPKGLRGAKYLTDEKIDVDRMKEKTVLYSGPATRAVQLFPANVNVAATVSLAGIGFDRTQVQVVCDPATDVNSHQLYVKGSFGEMESVTRNRPSPDNPRTSYLASLSAVSALKSYARKIWISV